MWGPFHIQGHRFPCWRMKWLNKAQKAPSGAEATAHNGGSSAEGRARLLPGEPEPILPCGRARDRCPGVAFW